MPSFTEVPRSSLVASLTVPEAVLKLGGEAHDDQVASLLNRKLGGAWRYLVNSAAQHGLITYSNRQLAITPFYSDLVNTDEDKYRSLLQESFLRPNIYKALLTKLSDKNFDAETYLIEKGYDPNSAAIITRNFIEGAKLVGLYTRGEQSALFTPEASDPVHSRQEVSFNKETIMNAEQSNPQNASPQEPIETSRPRPLPPLPPKPYLGPVEKRVIQIPLPNNRVAELTIPSDLSLKDLNVINMQMEVLKAYVDNS
jgi:hypothetical protein